MAYYLHLRALAPTREAMAVVLRDLMETLSKHDNGFVPLAEGEYDYYMTETNAENVYDARDEVEGR